MALIEKLKAIGDAIRGRTGTTDELTLDEMAETINSMEVGTGDDVSTYILVDENGYEVPAVLVDEEVTLTATPNDIRIGTTAVTEQGVVTGEKEIPSHRAESGVTFVKPNTALEIATFSDMCEYTVLQAIICGYNTNIDDSVASEKVVIDDTVYSVNSTVALAKIYIDSEAQVIKLGVSNDSGKTLIIRYMIIKEDA